MESSDKSSESAGQDSRKIDWKKVWSRIGMAFVVAFCLCLFFVGLYILAMPYLYAWDKGYESVTEALSRGKRAEMAEIEKSVKSQISDIEAKADKDEALAARPLERLDAERRELVIRKRKAGNRITARSFAECEGLRELAEDSVRLEDAIRKVTIDSKRIRLLHVALGQRKFMSSSIRKSSDCLEKLRKAHKSIMDDMQDASGMSSQNRVGSE